MRIPMILHDTVADGVPSSIVPTKCASQNSRTPYVPTFPGVEGSGLRALRLTLTTFLLTFWYGESFSVFLRRNSIFVNDSTSCLFTLNYQVQIPQKPSFELANFFSRYALRKALRKSHFSFGLFAPLRSFLSADIVVHHVVMKMILTIATNANNKLLNTISQFLCQQRVNSYSDASAVKRSF